MKQERELLERLRQANKLDPSRAGGRPIVASSGLSPEMSLLRSWQMERLRRTHADFLSSERYGPACLFFLNDIYAPRDFSQRDRDVEHVYAVMSRYLPLKMLQTLEQVIELNDLTNALDAALLDKLVGDLGMTTELTPAMYAEAYRLCRNYDERVRQLDQLVEVGHGVNKLVHRPFVGALLRLAHGPAHRAGWSDLQDFLEGGYAAFQAMDDAAPFLEVVEQRERLILARIYAGEPDPFTLPG